MPTVSPSPNGPMGTRGRPRDHDGRMPDRPLTPDEYWSLPAAVGSMDRGRAPAHYEDLLLADAVSLAGAPDAIRTVHVLGVGAGRELPAVRRAAPTARILAWDVAPGMVEACRRNLDGAGLGEVEVAARAAGDLAPDDGRAQLVVGLNAVLGYVVPAAERRRTVAALAAVLEPGGVLAAVVQQRRGRPDWAAWFLAHDALAAAHLIGSAPGDRWIGDDGPTVAHHHYTRRELVDLLAGAGIEPTRVGSLRRFVGPHGIRPPLRSPNPLVALAVRRSSS